MSTRNGSTRSYAGNPTKHAFPRYRQEHAESCGPACLRMIAEWSKNEARSEYYWRERSRWKVGVGLLPAGMNAQLVELGKCDAVPFRDLARLAGVEADEVYVLFTDSYGYDGRNVHHWIILLDLFASKSSKQDPEIQRLALCADPMEDQLAVWRWESLLASRVTEAFKISKP